MGSLYHSSVIKEATEPCRWKTNKEIKIDAKTGESRANEKEFKGWIVDQIVVGMQVDSTAVG